MLQIEIAALSDQGPRPENQDNIYIYNEEKIAFAIVADGMGGASGGSMASQLAVESFTTYFEKNQTKLSPSKALQFLKDAILFANSQIYKVAKGDSGLEGMGTTIVVLMIVGNRYYHAHVGDSRAMLVRNNRLVNLTEDHSFVQELLKAGSITEELARKHPQKNIITRALGVEKSVEPELHDGDLSPNDLFILTSDGIHGFLDDGEYISCSKLGEVQESCKHLIDRAIQNRTTDNASAAVIRYMKTSEKNDHDHLAGTDKTLTVKSSYADQHASTRKINPVIKKSLYIIPIPFILCVAFIWSFIYLNDNNSDNAKIPIKHSSSSVIPSTITASVSIEPQVGNSDIATTNSITTTSNENTITTQPSERRKDETSNNTNQN